MSSTLSYMSMSLDGFIAGPNEGPETRWATAALACTNGSGRTRRSISTMPSPDCRERTQRWSKNSWRPGLSWPVAALSNRPTAGAETTTMASRSTS